MEDRCNESGRALGSVLVLIRAYYLVFKKQTISEQVFGDDGVFCMFILVLVPDVGVLAGHVLFV